MEVLKGTCWSGLQAGIPPAEVGDMLLNLKSALGNQGDNRHATGAIREFEVVEFKQDPEKSLSQNDELEGPDDREAKMHALMGSGDIKMATAGSRKSTSYAPTQAELDSNLTIRQASSEEACQIFKPFSWCGPGAYATFRDLELRDDLHEFQLRPNKKGLWERKLPKRTGSNIRRLTKQSSWIKRHLHEDKGNHVTGRVKRVLFEGGDIGLDGKADRGNDIVELSLWSRTELKWLTRTAKVEDLRASTAEEQEAWNDVTREQMRQQEEDEIREAQLCKDRFYSVAIDVSSVAAQSDTDKDALIERIVSEQLHSRISGYRESTSVFSVVLDLQGQTRWQAEAVRLKAELKSLPTRALRRRLDRDLGDRARRTVWIGGLPSAATEENVKQTLEAGGLVQVETVHIRRKNGASKDWALAMLSKPAQVERTCEAEFQRACGKALQADMNLEDQPPLQIEVVERRKLQSWDARLVGKGVVLDSDRLVESVQPEDELFDKLRDLWAAERTIVARILRYTQNLPQNYATQGRGEALTRAVLSYLQVSANPLWGCFHLAAKLNEQADNGNDARQSRPSREVAQIMVRLATKLAAELQLPSNDFALMAAWLQPKFNYSPETSKNEPPEGGPFVQLKWYLRLLWHGIHIAKTGSVTAGPLYEAIVNEDLDFLHVEWVQAYINHIRSASFTVEDEFTMDLPIGPRHGLVGTQVIEKVRGWCWQYVVDCGLQDCRLFFDGFFHSWTGIQAPNAHFRIPVARYLFDLIVYLVFLYFWTWGMALDYWGASSFTTAEVMAGDAALALGENDSSVLMTRIWCWLYLIGCMEKEFRQLLRLGVRSYFSE